MDDPAYHWELSKLDKMVDEYREARMKGNDDWALVSIGMMLAQIAAIYKLSEPAGLIDPADLFRRGEE